MEDDASIFLDGKTLANLRVVDLKLELDKRGLSKSGSKKDLVKRLKQQLEFEKLCGERKSTGDCDLKLELDADTEQNEFVQQYLAQQQKIYAQQKEVKRRVELEEIQKSGDEKESCDSTKGDDDKTEDESETEPKDEKGDQIPNDSAISLPRHTKDKNEDVFETTGAAHPTPVNQDGHLTEKKNHSAEDVVKDRKALVLDECPAETLKPKAEVRDIEKDREKELSTAISSLLSVEKSDKRVDNREDLTTTEDSVAVDGTVTRMTHDDDREKDLATAVLSSLLVGEDVEKEAKSEEVVSDNREVNGAPAQLESDVVTECVETETSSGIGETCDKGLPDSVDMSAEITIDAKDGGQLEVDGTCAQLESNIDVECIDTETSSGIAETCDKGLPDSVEVSAESTINTKDGQLEVDKACAQLESKVVVECGRAETSSGIGEACEKHLHDSVEVNVESTIAAKDEVQSGDVEDSLEVVQKPLSELLPDSVEVNVESTIDVKDGSHSEAYLEVVQKPPVESSKITRAVQEEISSNMDVSSVPYSLSEIQLPESPVNIVKPQAKSQSGNESSKTTESEEDIHSSSVNSKSNNKIKRSESGDLNGRDTKSSKEGKNSEDPAQINLKKEPESEKEHHEKGSEVGNTKRSKVDRSDSDTSSGDEKSRSSRRDKGHRKKYDSSDDNRNLVKKSLDSSRSKPERRKGRRNRSSSSESGRSRDRSRSPKGSKSSRRDRNHHRRSRSSEKDQRFRTKSKRGSPKKSSREGRRKRDRRHRSGSAEDDRSLTKDRSPKKAPKVGRRERSVSSDEERLSRTKSRESPKKDVKIGRKEKSVSSGDERPSRTQSKESPKKEAKVSCRKRSVSSEEEGPLNLGNKDGQKSKAVLSMKEQSQSPEKEQRSLSQSQEGLKRESQTSQKEKSPIKEARGSGDEQDSGTSSSESSLKKTPEKMEVKDSKRKYSVSSDDESRREESAVKKPKPIPTDDVSKSEDMQEKMDCQTPEDKPARSGRSSSPRPTRSSRPDERRTNFSRSKSPEKVSITGESVSRSDKRPPSPKVARRPSSSESSPGNDNSKVSPEGVSKEAPKGEVSEGELTSSRENSPAGGEAVSKWEGVAVRKPSMDSSVSKQSTITVIKKEAPKQKLKIKRDNVIIIKKEKKSESLPDEGHGTTESSVVQTPEPIEKLESGECPEVPPSTTYVSRKITLSNRKQTEKLSEEPATKRSKWGSFAASRKTKQTVSISTDSLKNWFPDFKLLKEPVAELTPEDPPSPSKDANEVEMTSVERGGGDVEEPKISAVTKRLEQPPIEEEPKVAALDTPLDDGAEPTCILFVRNLVRPFTLLQLKEILRETGKMVDEQFWIDKIKSKCFVTYETEEEAVKTRSVLNGARWPMSNPKILAVDFATEDDLAFHRSGAVDRPKPLPPSSPPRPAARPSKERERRTPERDGRRERLPVREWDKDKMRQDSPEKMERRREEDRTKGTDKDKKEGTKKRPNEDTPAKLLDDLFQKTKATPCIYWLPLNQEQAKERAEQLRQVRLDRERRNQEREQENKRPRSKQRMRETDTRRSSSRSHSPVTRRR